MKRSLSVLLSFAGAIALASCSDPTGDLGRGDPTDIGATPSTVVVTLGTTKTVTVQLFDKQGNPLSGNFTAASTNAAVVTVEADTSFRPGLGGNTLAARFILTALQADSASVTISSRGVSQVVPVVVNPAAVANASLSATAPNIGDVVTITATGNVLFTAATTVSFNIGATATPAVVTGFTANTISFIPIPGSSSAATIGNVTLPYSPTLGDVSFLTSNSLSVAAIATVTAVFSDVTPDINQDVTVTAAGYKFAPGATVTYGGEQQLVTSISADSSTLTFRAGQSGAAGPVAFTGLLLSGLVPLSVPSDADITVSSTILSLAGTTDTATAPGANIPTAGHSSILNDGGAFAACTASNPGGFPCRIYKLVSDGSDFDISATWNNNADLGVYFTDAAGADTGLHDCDLGGAGAGGHPETCSFTGMAAGTYYMYVNTYASAYPAPNNVDPTSIAITISRP